MSTQEDTIDTLPASIKAEEQREKEQARRYTAQGYAAQQELNVKITEAKAEKRAAAAAPVVAERAALANAAMLAVTLKDVEAADKQALLVAELQRQGKPWAQIYREVKVRLLVH